MKRIIIFLVAALLLTSCSMQVSDKTGSLSLSGARGVVSDLAGPNAVVRYALTRNGKTIPLNGQSLLEIAGSDSVTIDRLIPGEGYKLAVSVGTKEGNNFVVSHYGYSETFALAEGTNSSVNVGLEEAPNFTWLTSTGGKSSAAVVVSNIFILDSNNLLQYDISDLGTNTPYSIGLNVNSLSVGKTSSANPVLWLNTTSGLFWRDGTSNVPLNNGHTGNVLFSRAVTLPTTGGIGVYSGGGSNIGFLYSASHTFTGPWLTSADYPEIADFLPEITQDVIRGIAVNHTNEFIYVVTSLGTAIGNSAIDDISDILNIGGGSWLNIPGVNTPINVVSTAGLRVFAGTNYGLYTSSVLATGSPDGSGFSIVAGTEGKKIVALESYYFSTTVYTAAVTNDNWVYLIEGNTLLAANTNHPNPIPAAVGIPLNVKPVFYSVGSNLHLILSGNNGSFNYQIINNPS